MSIAQNAYGSLSAERDECEDDRNRAVFGIPLKERYRRSEAEMEAAQKRRQSALESTAKAREELTTALRKLAGDVFSFNFYNHCVDEVHTGHLFLETRISLSGTDAKRGFVELKGKVAELLRRLEDVHL